MSLSDRDVGYKRPPKQHRFKPKQSGNPNGRPKGSGKKKNSGQNRADELDELTIEELLRKVVVSENGNPVEMPVAKAIERAISSAAVKGNSPAAKLMLDELRKALGRQTKLREEAFHRAYLYKKLKTAEIARAKRSKRPFKLPVPHPDHIKLDWEAQAVTIDGPMDQDQLEDYKCAIATMTRMEFEIDVAEIEGLGDDEGWIEQIQNILDRLRGVMPVDDPLWREFAPDFRRALIDHHYYYGPLPNLPARPAVMPKALRREAREISRSFPPEVRREAKQLLANQDDFRPLMRDKLKELMGEAWDNRFEGTYHEPRDIEHDRIRWEYEMGTFDANKFQFTEHEKQALEDPVFLKTYMAW